MKPQSFVTFCLSRSLPPSPSAPRCPSPLPPWPRWHLLPAGDLDLQQEHPGTRGKGGGGFSGTETTKLCGSLFCAAFPASRFPSDSVLAPLLYFRSAVYLSVCLWSHLPSCIRYSHVPLPILPTTDSWGQGPGLVFSLSLQTKLSM